MSPGRALVLIVAVAITMSCSAAEDDAATSTTATTATPAATTTPATTTPFSTTPASTTAPLPPGAEPLDLTAFAAAWSSGDVAAIRALYTDDALHATVAGSGAPDTGEPAPVRVADVSFDAVVAAVDADELRITGQPYRLGDKVAAFTFRWEGEVDGVDGAAILRYEGDRILLHSEALASTRTPNPPPGTTDATGVDLSGFMDAWASGDLDTLTTWYTDDAVVVNDEDLVERDADPTYVSPSLSAELRQIAPWAPEALGDATRVGDVAVLPFRWSTFDPPVGEGVRLLVFDGDRIAHDVRYVVRPWEATGASFASGL